MVNARAAGLRIATGTGRLCRTEHGVLYVPDPASGWEDLAAAARGAGADDGIAAVAESLTARELDAPAFVYVVWHPRIAVLVFGDVELRTDQRAVPMLTGAGSQTWVEHSVPAAGGAVTVYVTPPEDEDTDLTAGTVPAGGFTLRIDAAPVASDHRAGVANDAATPVASPLPPPEPSRSTSSTSSPPPAPEGVRETQPGRDPASERGGDPVPGAEWRPPGIDASDPQAALHAIQAAAVPDETQEDTGPWSASASRQPQLQGTEGQAVDPSGDVPRLVEAVRCPEGHPNPPGRGSCRGCGGLIAPDAVLGAVPQPSLGAIELDDGTVIELSSDLLLGRRPSAREGARQVTIEGDRVSRTHAEVSLHRWEVRLRDLGSRNGTFIVAPGSSELVRVEPEVPVRLEAGMTVYLGTRSFVIRVDSG